jgi:hypothetical protein
MAGKRGLEGNFTPCWHRFRLRAHVGEDVTEISVEEEQKNRRIILMSALSK